MWLRERLHWFWLIQGSGKIDNSLHDMRLRRALPTSTGLGSGRATVFFADKKYIHQSFQPCERVLNSRYARANTNTLRVNYTKICYLKFHVLETIIRQS